MFELLLQADEALAQGKLDQADRLYSQLVALDPRNAMAVAGLAHISLERGDDDMARNLAERALELDPEAVLASRVIMALEDPDAIGREAWEPLIAEGARRRGGPETVRPLEARRRAKVAGWSSLSGERRHAVDPFAAAEAEAAIEAIDTYDTLGPEAPEGSAAAPTPDAATPAPAPLSAPATPAATRAEASPAVAAPTAGAARVAPTTDREAAAVLPLATPVLLPGLLESPAVGAAREERAVEEALAEMLDNDLVWEVASITHSKAPLARGHKGAPGTVEGAQAQAEAEASHKKGLFGRFGGR
jgi:hypothetical protein